MAKRSTLNLNRIRLQDQRRMLKFERKYSMLFYGALEKSVEPVLNNPDADINESAIKDVYIQLYEEVGVEFATVNFRFMDSLKMKAEPGFFLTTWKNWMKEFALSRLASKVVEINDTTRKKIKEALAYALDRGIASRAEVAKLISEKTLGDIGKRRAKTIARTETAAAANEGKEKSADDWAEDAEEDLYKIWIAGGSKEPRQSHLDLDNGKAIPKGYFWFVEGEEMQRPHDPTASAGNVVNCNCTVVYVSERYAKRLNASK